MGHLKDQYIFIQELKYINCPMLKKVNRHRRRKEGWDVVRTKIILDRLSKNDSLFVDGCKYHLLGILGKGGYSCVFRYLFSPLAHSKLHRLSED